jgi:diguanylate cyclase (GGDEF)-like protein
VGEPITTEHLARFAEYRNAAASDRGRASKDRQAAAGERNDAQDDRVDARDDREAGAGDRAESQLDRAAASGDRLAGAGGRGRAWLDRDTALADRGAGASERDEAGQDRDAALADRGASAVELERSSYDALTGAYLRGAGLTELKREIMRARRERQPLVLAFVDVDGLKGVNDRAGHATGDLVLRTLVTTMRSNLRSFDPIVRYGGDEFVCAVGGVDVDEVEARFERIRRSLFADTGVGISVGLAAAAEGETLDELTARADAALLDEKRLRQA